MRYSALSYPFLCFTVITFAKNYNDMDSRTWMARYNFYFSPRTDIALHAEYNAFRAKGVGTAGGDQLGQTMLVGLDFAY